MRDAVVVSAGAISSRGVYEALDRLGLVAPERAEAAVVRRREEQYLIDSLEVISDSGVAVVIPPIYNDVITAKLAPGKTWNATALKSAKSRLESALKTVEAPYSATAAGLTIVVGWGLPYFRTYVPAQWKSRGPVDTVLTTDPANPQFAVLDAIAFPSDPSTVVLEDNHVSFKLRSDSQDILRSVEKALFDNPANKAYVGDLFAVTSKRMGFVGRGFGGANVGKQLAVQAGVAGADQIPARSQLMMGFTSTLPAALGPDNIASFETLPGVTNQWPGGYFAAGCAMHLSHLNLDLATWYGYDYGRRVARMYDSHRAVPTDNRVTLANGPAEITSRAQLSDDASTGVIGHNETLQQATRLQANVIDNYGRTRAAGTAVPIREDFNTLDNPFAWPSSGPAVAGLHFAAFVPASRLFHKARLAMDGVLPDGTNLRGQIPDSNNGINAIMAATHRQNFVIPPRSNRSFPLAELL
jgi:pimeloyl-ACP methyl ester carboxylesterase